MALTSIQLLQPLAPNGEQPFLTVPDGGRVFVRVLEQTAPHTYTVLLSGAPVTVHSEQPLSKGEHFFAKIVSYKNTAFELIPEKEATVPQHQPIQNTSNTYTIEQFLQSEGLFADELTARVFTFLEQMGVKIDKTLMQKARSIGQRFGKKSKPASEAAALLLQKGIYPTKEAIEAILFATADFYEGTKNGGNGEPKHKKSENESPSFIDALYAVPPQKKEGILTLSNHIAPKHKHWIVLPYEWSPAGVNAKASAFGTITILLNIPLKNAEKMHIQCKTLLNNYSFLLYYKDGTPAHLCFCITPEPSKAKREALCQELTERLYGGGFLKTVTVAYSEDAALQEEALFTVKEQTPFVSVYV